MRLVERCGRGLECVARRQREGDAIGVACGDLGDRCGHRDLLAAGLAPRLRDRRGHGDLLLRDVVAADVAEQALEGRVAGALELCLDARLGDDVRRVLAQLERTVALEDAEARLFDRHGAGACQQCGDRGQPACVNPRLHWGVDSGSEGDGEVSDDHSFGGGDALDYSARPRPRPSGPPAAVQKSCRRFLSRREAAPRRVLQGTRGGRRNEYLCELRR